MFAIGLVHSDNRLAATLMMGPFATGVATSWTEAGTGGKDDPDSFARREGRFRRYKRLNYLRRCRAANRSATVAFATVPAAAAIAAAMFGSSATMLVRARKEAPSLTLI